MIVRDKVISLLEIENTNNNLVVLCNDDINEIKDAIIFIIENKMDNINVIFDNDKGNDPFNSETPIVKFLLKQKSRKINDIRGSTF